MNDNERKGEELQPSSSSFSSMHDKMENAEMRNDMETTVTADTNKMDLMNRRNDDNDDDKNKNKNVKVDYKNKN